MKREAEQGTPRKVGGAERKGSGGRNQGKGSGTNVKEKASYLSIPYSQQSGHKKVPKSCITSFYNERTESWREGTDFRSH